MQPREGRQDDPRGLSEKHPGRSKIQDDPPSLPAADAAKRRTDEQTSTVVTAPPPSDADLERRDARGHGAMPYGTKGSRRGKPAGGGRTEEDKRHTSSKE